MAATPMGAAVVASLIEAISISVLPTTGLKFLDVILCANISLMCMVKGDCNAPSLNIA